MVKRKLRERREGRERRGGNVDEAIQALETWRVKMKHVRLIITYQKMLHTTYCLI